MCCFLVREIGIHGRAARPWLGIKQSVLVLCKKQESKTNATDSCTAVSNHAAPRTFHSPVDVAARTTPHARPHDRRHVFVKGPVRVLARANLVESARVLKGLEESRVAAVGRQRV